jgi:HTH-type transcriptional regulator, competence development regulator
MDTAKIIFGRRLRLLRKARRLTLEKLGQASAIGFKHIGDIEKGLKAPSFEAIDRLAKALKVSPYELFLPFDLDSAHLDQTLRRITRDIDDSGSPPLKRFLVVALPLLRQLEAESSR